MNDPEAKAIYDKRLKEFIQSKSQTYPYYLTMPNLETVANSFAVKKLIELLTVTRYIEVISGDSPIPHDEIVLFSLIILCKRHDIKLPQIENYEEDITKYILSHKKDIVNAAERLIKKLEQEEKYWMENMPFDYVPQTVK
jgi:hypothetical protein